MGILYKRPNSGCGVPEGNPAEVCAGVALLRNLQMERRQPIEEVRMNTAMLLGELALAVGFLGVIVRGLVEQIQELRLLEAREKGAV